MLFSFLSFSHFGAFVDSRRSPFKWTDGNLTVRSAKTKPQYKVGLRTATPNSRPMFNSLSCQSIPYSPPTGVARYVLVHFKGTPTVLIRHDNRVHEAFVNNKTAMKGGLDFKHMRALFNGWMDQIACSDTPCLVVSSAKPSSLCRSKRIYLGTAARPTT